MNALIANYSQARQHVRPQSVTFDALCNAVYATIRETAPSFIPTPRVEYRIHDLFVLCPPDLQREGARWLLPGHFQKLAREIAEDVGAQIVKGQTA